MRTLGHTIMAGVILLGFVCLLGLAIFLSLLVPIGQ